MEAPALPFVAIPGDVAAGHRDSALSDVHVEQESRFLRDHESRGPLGGLHEPTQQPGHTLRTHGTIRVADGSEQALFGNTSGALARALERWQLGLIYQPELGYPVSITAQSMLYGNGVRISSICRLQRNSREPVGVFVMDRSLKGVTSTQGDVFVKDDGTPCARPSTRHIRSLLFVGRLVTWLSRRECRRNPTSCFNDRRDTSGCGGASITPRPERREVSGTIP
jgi:hypothetical protein